MAIRAIIPMKRNFFYVWSSSVNLCHLTKNLVLLHSNHTTQSNEVFKTRIQVLVIYLQMNLPFSTNFAHITNALLPPLSRQIQETLSNQLTN